MTPTVGDGDRRLRVEAILSGRLAPSSRYRVLQHVPALGALGIDVSAPPPRISKYASVPDRWARRHLAGPALGAALKPAKVAVRVPALAATWRADVSWLEREMLPGHLTLEPLLKRPMLFDVDDSIWLLSPGHGRAVAAIARRSTGVIAGNDFLAEWFSSRAPAVECVWTAVDTDRLTPAAERDGPFTVGWTGTGSSLRYLRAISPTLSRFMTAAPDARLVVSAEAMVDLPGVPPERVEFVPWSPETEVEVLRRFDVGIMPLPDTDWTRGKCAFKMLQYMACGVPAVVSPVGMSAQVLAMADVGLAATGEDEWVDALMTLHRDRDLARTLGQAGRELAEKSFSVPVIARQLAAIMRRYG